MIFDEKNGPSEVSCACPVGNFICSHALTLMMFCQKMLSRTDFGSVWNRPKQNELDVKHRIRDVWMNDPKQVLISPMTTEDCDVLQKMADKTKQFGLSWLLQKQAEQVPVLDFNIFTWLKSEEFKNAGNQKNWILDRLKLTQTQIDHIQRLTLGQGTNSEWLTIRLGRITASVFSLIIRAVSATIDKATFKFSDTLFKSLTHISKLDKVKSISWGISHESDAISIYECTTNQKVVRTGIRFLECGFIGASPDGLVGEDKIIEVKCPYSLRQKSLQDAKKMKNFCLQLNASGCYELPRSHPYYDQVQGCLWVTGRSECDFIYWTPDWTLIVPVQRNTEWFDNLNLIEIFYKEIFLDYIITNNQ
jgi:YqaJ-like viral recombinase domain